MNTSAIRAIAGAMSKKSKDLFIPHQGNDFKPRFLQSKLLLSLVVGILALKIATVLLYLPLSYNLFFADVTKTDLLNLLNQNRQVLGLTTLVENQKLNEAAYLKAQDMVRDGYFSHQSPSGITPWFWFKKAGYDYKYAGENLAVGFVDSSTVYDAWYNSPSHKENLLNKNYTEIGTAVVTGFQGNSTIIVQLFGRPKTVVTANPKSETLNSKQTPISETQNPKPAPTPTPAPAPVSAPVPAPEPTPEPVLAQENTTANVIPTVLAESTEYIQGPEYAGKRSFYLQMLNFVVYDNNTILQYLSLGVLAIILTCLAINGILMFQVQNRVMLLRPVFLAVALGIALFLDKEMVGHLLPYQVTI